MGKNITRKDFLTNTSKYAVGAVAGVAGLNLLSGNKIFGNPKSTWPLSYSTIDPEIARIKAHTLYYGDKDCCSGVFGAFTELLSASVGEPWTSIPMEIMLYGRGGGVGWGSICGAINGGAAIISAVTDKASSTSLINELWGWYTTESLPTNAANAATYEDRRYTDSIQQNVAGSPLCHSSVSQWCMVANKKVSDIERKERCARIAGDCAAKTAEILNAHFASTFTSTFVAPASNAGCLSACHGSAGANNVMTNMECVSCHPDAHDGSSTSVEALSILPTDYQLENAFPNPFNPSTNIQFSIPKAEKVRLEVYDIRGRLVTSLIDSEIMNPGTYKSSWSGKNNLGERVSSGVYLARLTTGSFMKTIKMNLIK